MAKVVSGCCGFSEVTCVSCIVVDVKFKIDGVCGRFVVACVVSISFVVKIKVVCGGSVFSEVICVNPIVVGVEFDVKGRLVVARISSMVLNFGLEVEVKDEDEVEVEVKMVDVVEVEDLAGVMTTSLQSSFL